MAERAVLDRILIEARSEKSLSRIAWERLRSTFGYRFDRAWRLVEEKRIKKYIFLPSKRVNWLAIGQNGEYLIYPKSGYCGCDDFYFRVIDGETPICYHLLGLYLAEALGVVDEIEEEDDVYNLLQKEWWNQIINEIND